METSKNKEKASDIAFKNARPYVSLDLNELTNESSFDECKQSALDAMEWKQSEIEQWLEDNIYDYMYDDDDDTTCIDIQKLIKDLRKTY